MKKTPLLFSLLLSSSLVYAGWTTKGTDYKGDCLEMICEHGCVEDSEGEGNCCPNGTAFTNTGDSHPTYTPCKCPENQSWDTTLSQCVECLTDANCDEGVSCNILTKVCCPAETPKWDSVQQKCVECLSDYGSGEQNACSEEKPICDTSDYICKSCAEVDPLKLYWDENQKRCIQCLSNYGSEEDFACVSEEKPLCDTADYTCKTCAEADPTKPYWNAKLGKCVECVQDDQCPTPSDSKNDAVCFNGACQECPKRIDIVAQKTGTNGGSHAGSSVFKSGLYGHEYCSYDLHLKGYALSQSFSLTFTGDVETIRETTYGCIKCCNSRTFDGGVYHRLHPGTYFKTFYQYSDYGKHCDYLTFTMDEAYLERVPNCTDCTYKSGVDASFTFEKCANQPDRYFKDGKCYACPAGTIANDDHTECLCEKGNYLSGEKCYSCTDKTYKVTSEAGCYAKCPKNTRMWRKTNSYCFDCNYTSVISSTTKEECNHCPNRYFKDGKCSLCPANSKPNSDNSDCVCNEGYYMSNGACYSCTDKTYRATTEAACYNTCPDNTRLWRKTNSYCFDCNYASVITSATKEECNHCPNRYFKDGKCSLCPANAKPNADNSDCVCNEGYYMSNGACYSCTDKTVRKTTEDACYSTCPENTRMWSAYKGNNYCFDCNYASGVNAWFTKEECNHCPNRYFKDGKCSLCPKGKQPNADRTDCE